MENKIVILKTAAGLLNVSYSTLYRELKENPNHPALHYVGKSKMLNINKYLEYKSAQGLKKEVEVQDSFSKLKQYYISKSSYLGSLNEKTANYHIACLNHAERFFQDKALNRQTLFQYRDYLLKDKTKSPGTVKKYITAVNQLVKNCVRVGLLESDFTFELTSGLKTKQREYFFDNLAREKLEIIKESNRCIKWFCECKT